MNTVRQPMLWAAVALIAGVVAGSHWPLRSAMFVLLPLSMVAGACVLWWRGARTVVVMLLWMVLGVLRVGIIRTAGADAGQSFLQQDGRSSSIALTQRLQDAGIEGDALRLTASVLLGRRDMLSNDVRREFRQLGVSHLLALSGMHLGVLYALLYLLFIRWMRLSRWRWLALLVALLLIWSYTVIAGKPQSLIRAAVMLSVVCVGMSLYRWVSLLQLLGIAAAAMLLYDPMGLYDVGFQLSFMAVFFIAVLFVPVRRIFIIHKRPVRYFVDLLLVSLVAQLGTAPLSMYYFHTFPVAAFLAGLAMIPLVSLLLCAGLATLIFPCWLTGGVTAMMAQATLWCSEHLQVLGRFTLHGLHPSLMSVALVYAYLLLFVLRVRRHLSEGAPFADEWHI